MKILKNLGLLVLVLVLSYLTAQYFGSWYDKFSPLYDRSMIGFSKSDLVTIVGLPFAYIFFTTLLFQICATGNKKKWTLWLLAPAFLFFLSGDLKHIYLPIILALVAFGIARLVNFLRFKSHQPHKTINNDRY